MATPQQLKVGIIIGSQRVVRIGPEVANFILNTIKAHDASPASSRPSTATTVLELIDIKEYNLPLFDEPNIPNQVKSPEDHANEHTRIWARCITSCDAFVFVTSQRNWGIPAELKNAIDYLYHEWTSKPAIIVSYGGHGGVQSAEQLRTVIASIGMRVSPKMIHMTFPTTEFRINAFKGKFLGLDSTSDSAPWSQHRKEICMAWDSTIYNATLAGHRIP